MTRLAEGMVSYRRGRNSPVNCGNAPSERRRTAPAVVTKKMLSEVLEELSSEDADANVLQQLAAREPVLAAYLSERAVSASGKLALSGAPPEVVRACYADLLETV